MLQLPAESSGHAKRGSSHQAAAALRSPVDRPRLPTELVRADEGRALLLERWSQRGKALFLPPSVRGIRNQIGEPPGPRVRTCPEDYFHTPQEKEAAAEVRSFHSGPLSPASLAFRTRAQNEKELAIQQKAMRRTHQDNHRLEAVLSDCYTMSAQPHLDAFATAVEAHIGESTVIRLQSSAKVSCATSRIWRDPTASAHRTMTFASASENAPDPSSAFSMFLPKKAVPTLRFPSAIEQDPPKPRASDDSRKMPPIRPANAARKTDLKALLQEQLEMDAALHQSSQRYEAMLRDFETSQKAAHAMLDLYLSQSSRALPSCTRPDHPTRDDDLEEDELDLDEP